MGWWMSMELDGGGEEAFTVTSWNYTHNTNGMLRLAFDDDAYLGAIDGMAGKDALPLLERAVDFLCAPVNQKVLEKLEAPNDGWGSRVGIVGVLRDMARYCKEAPLATFSGPRG